MISSSFLANWLNWSVQVFILNSSSLSCLLVLLGKSFRMSILVVPLAFVCFYFQIVKSLFPPFWQIWFLYLLDLEAMTCRFVGLLKLNLMKKAGACCLFIVNSLSCAFREIKLALLLGEPLEILMTEGSVNDITWIFLVIFYKKGSAVDQWPHNKGALEVPLYV